MALRFTFDDGKACHAMGLLIADMKEAEHLEVEARRFLKTLRLAGYRPSDN